MEYISNVYVINMDESKERMQNVTTHLNRLEIPFTRIPAINGKLMSPDEIKKNTTTLCNYFCTYSMIGCFLSHKKTWETVVNNNDPYAIIIEDDCEFVDTFKSDLKNIMDELIPLNPDFVYLGCFGGCEANKSNYTLVPFLQSLILPNIINKTSNLTFSYIPQAPVGTHCYIISNNCAKKLIKLMDKADYHVDVSFLNHANKFNVYASKKKIAVQRSSAEQSTQSVFKFPVTLNYIFDKFHDNNHISYSFYLSSPMCEILWHPVNMYLIFACLFAMFIPDIKLFFSFFTYFLLLEAIIKPSNITVIIHWMLFVYSILYIRIYITTKK